MNSNMFALIALAYLMLGWTLWVWAVQLDRIDARRRQHSTRTGDHRRLTLMLYGTAILACVPLATAFFMLGLAHTMMGRP